MSWGYTGRIEYSTLSAFNSATKATMSWWELQDPADVFPNWVNHFGGVFGAYQEAGDETDLNVVVNGVTGRTGNGGLTYAGTWVQYALVFDGTLATAADRLKLYKGAVLVPWNSSPAFPTGLGTLSDNLTFGSNAGGSSGTALKKWAEAGLWNGVALDATNLGYLAAGYKPSLLTPAADHYISFANSGNANADVGGLTTSTNGATYYATHPTMEPGAPGGGGGGGSTRNRVMVVL